MTALDHIRLIVARHRYRQSLPNRYCDDLGDLWSPQVICPPSGREILFDSEILRAVEDLAACLRRDDSDLERSVRNDEWLKLVRDGVAYALDASDHSVALDVAACHVLNDVKKSLALSKEGLGQFEFAFGCTLFEGVVPQPFRIGPARFETRQDWLERKCTEGAISDTTKRRVLRAWEGQVPRKRIRSLDSSQEDAVLGLSRDASFICSVSTNGMSHEFGQQRARTTARLALAAIALAWRSTSRALEGMNLVDDRVVRSLHEFTFRDGRPASWGGRKSHMPSGPTLSVEEWDKLQNDFAGHFMVAGDLLASITDIASTPKRPRTTHALTHALLWFHQGCREDEPVIAVANFASALDCLTAEGGGQEGIKKLIKALCGLSDEQALWARGDQTVKQAVEEIYDHARTATIHGLKGRKNCKPESKPFVDWSPGRYRAEVLARHCLLACIDRVAEHPDEDAPESWQTA